MMNLFIFFSFLCLCIFHVVKVIGQVGIPLDLGEDRSAKNPFRRFQAANSGQKISRGFVEFVEQGFLNNAIESGRQYIRNLEDIDNTLARFKSTSRRRQGGDDVCDRYFAEPNNAREARELGKQGIILAVAAGTLYGVSGVDKEAILNVSTAVQLDCPRKTKDTRCLGGRFRAINGFCNNVQHPWWGGELKPLNHLLSPDYFDDAQEPRVVGKLGEDLPSARDVSRFLHTYRTGDVRPLQKALSVLFPAFAHFVHTDLMQLSQWRSPNGECINCCQLGYHPECLNIYTTDSDQVFGQQKCLPYSRLLPGILEDCKLGPRTPANMATSFLDGSAVYGSNSDVAGTLRTFQGGRLKTEVREPGWVELPLPDIDRLSCRSGLNVPCFSFGAQGGNFVPISMNILFFREHNRIAGLLAGLNPQWNDQRLYDEAKAIVGAKIQRIAYTEYLPLLLGEIGIQEYGLELNSVGYYGGYDRDTNAQISVAFATAAGLYYNTLWPDEIKTDGTGGGIPLSARLSEILYNPEWLLQNGGLEGLLSSAAKENPSVRGQYWSSELTENFLGHDLAAIVIQMGRDVGLRKYTEWRGACGLTEVRSFADLVSVAGIQYNTVNLLESIYGSVEDIDLLTGGAVEPSVPGGLIGETFACILGTQFQAIRRGDRFWHENYFYPSAFTERQLSTIRKSSLSRLICDNTNTERIQPRALRAADVFENCEVWCNGTTIERSDVDGFIDAEPSVSMEISQSTLQKAMDLGIQLAKEKSGRGSKTSAVMAHTSSSFLHFLTMNPSQYAVEISELSRSLMETTRLLIGRSQERSDYAFELDLPEDLDENTLQTLLPNIDVRSILPETPKSECLSRNWPCDHTAKFRSMTGWCNNLRFAEYGSSFIAFRRLLSPKYDDGFNAPRTLSAKPRRSLPSAREVSLRVHHIAGRSQPIYSHLLMQFGQFLDHDITLTPLTPDEEGHPLDCTECDSDQTVGADCFPIPIPDEDPFFPPRSPNGVPKCMGFTRSLLGGLKLGFREQMNEITAFVDGSNVYGADECRAAELRALTGGLLKYQTMWGNEEMLPDKDDNECTSRFNKCFFAGDIRANEQHGLTCMHTMFMREHNQLARELKVINPYWDDERLYQEARRIVIAELQKIAYSEFLPKVLGLAIMDKYDLLPETQGYYTRYSEECDPGISNVFAAAAYRFGHTLIQSEFEMRDEEDIMIGVIPLHTSFFSTDTFYDQPRYCDRVLRGMCGQSSMGYDRGFTESIINRLFEEEGKPRSGLDLPALNIQRGRDHGLPAYTEFRKLFGLKVPRTFRDLYGIMDNLTVIAMESVYEEVEDIDVYSGIMSEIPLKGALVGPTAAEIIGEQFSRLRRCDRFWFENKDQPGSFSTNQLAELRRTTLAKIMCKHAPGMAKIQPQIFTMPDDYQNQPIDCEKLEDIYLSHWRDQDSYCYVGKVLIERGKTEKISPCISCTCTADGPRCHSFRVLNCLQLLTEYSREEVMADDACFVQCRAFVDLRMARRVSY